MGVGDSRTPAEVREPASAQGEGRRYKVLKREFFFRPVVVDPVTCADARFAGPKRAPRETEARAEVLELCRDPSRLIATPISGKDQAGGSGREYGGLLGRPGAVDREPSIEQYARR